MAWCNSCMSSQCPCLEDDSNEGDDDDWFEEPETIEPTEREIWIAENRILDKE